MRDRQAEAALTSMSFLGGLLLGLASSPHCAGMCGGIASGLSFSIAPQGALAARLKVLGQAQAGKALSYMAMGALLGAAGSSLYGLFNHASAYAALQRISATVLVWTALGLVGLVPPPSIIARLFQPLNHWAWMTRRTGTGGVAALAGLVWGFLPCGMVYAALLYAMLSGTALAGALVMAGFALGTAPLLTAASLGVTQLTRLNRSPWMRWAACLGLVLFAVATLVWPASRHGLFCA